MLSSHGFYDRGSMTLHAQRWSRKNWGHRGSIGNKLLILSAAGIVPTICVALVGFQTISLLNQKASVIVAATSSLRNHLDGDMMHDDLRGDVLGLLLAETEREKARGRATLASDAKRLRDAVQRNRSIPALDTDVRAALDSLDPALESYLHQAEALGRLADQDRWRAVNRLAQFEKSFAELDRQQDRVSELVMAKEAAAER